MSSSENDDFPPPHITSVSPDYGKADAYPITITGEALASATYTTFTVGPTSQNGPINSVSGDTQVTTTVPKGLNTGNGKVTVTNPGGTSNSLDFVVQPS